MNLSGIWYPLFLLSAHRPLSPPPNPPFKRKIKFSPFETQCPFPHLRKPDPLWHLAPHLVQSESSLTDEKSISFCISNIHPITVAARPCSYDLGDLSHRSTWTQHLATPLSWQINTLRSWPGPDGLYRWSITQHPPLGCKANLSLQSEHITATTGWLNYQAGLPAGFSFPTTALCSSGQIWQHNYSPCIRTRLRSLWTEEWEHYPAYQM